MQFKFSSLEANIWKMYLLHVLRLAHMFGAIMIPFFLQFGKINFFQIMFLQVIFYLTIFLMEIPTGAIADKIGRKYSIALGFLLSGIGMFLYGSIPDFGVFIVCEIITGIGFSLVSGADYAILFDSLKALGKEKNSKKVFATYDSIGGLGIVIAAPIGSVIAASFTINFPLQLNIVTYLLGAGIALSLVEPKRKFLKENYFTQIKNGLKYLKNHKALLAIAIDSGIFLGLSFLLFWFYPLFFEKGKLDLWLWGFVAGAMNIVGFLAAGQLHKIEKFFSKKNLLMWLAVISGIGFIVGGLTNFLPFLIMLVLLIMGARTLRLGLLNHYANQFIPSERRATINSIIAMIRSIVLVVIYPIVGLGLDFNKDLVFIAIGILILLFAVSSRIEEEMLLN
ncbi:MAG: MFS transporter [Candidatus Diapherotrites archaeon]|nr:MFS transporter [Candidatus Diapherotrites archaeon]